jgi:hypothetical protein
MSTTKPAQSTLVVEQKVKAPIALGAFWFSILVGVFFMTLLLVDLSVIAFNQPAFTAQYFIWKSQAAYVKIMVNVISCTVPLALLTGIAGLVMMFTHKASVTRHCTDVIGFFALIGVIANTIMNLIGLNETVLEFAQKAQLDQLVGLFPKLEKTLWVNLGLNFVMFLCNVVRYHDQGNCDAGKVEAVKDKKD